MLMKIHAYIYHHASKAINEDLYQDKSYLKILVLIIRLMQSLSILSEI